MKSKNSLQWKIFALVSICLLAILCLVQVANAQSTSTFVQAASNHSAINIGETATLNITISNVENLYGLDVTLQWDNSVLEIIANTSFVGTQSYSGGVLNSPVLVVDDSVSQEAGTYHLVATSVNPADSFNGTGTIASLTFIAKSSGHAGFILQSELADHPLPEATSEIISHSDVAGSIEVLPSSSTTLSPTTTSSSSPSLSPSPSVPEFPSTIIFLVILVSVITTVLVYTKNRSNKLSE